MHIPIPPARNPGVDALVQGLLSVGYSSERILYEVPVPDAPWSAELVAFCDAPLDVRTAGVALVNSEHPLMPRVQAARSLGAPLCFSYTDHRYQVWRQQGHQAAFLAELAEEDLPGYFREHGAELSPGSIYRAKTWARLDGSFQSEFVDAGLFPLLELEAGAKLTELVERVVHTTRARLGWDRDASHVSEADGRWLLKAVFWLLAAKILQDKRVDGFVRLDLGDLDKVYGKLAAHYHGDEPEPVRMQNGQRSALEAAAQEVAHFGNCQLVSTEALAHLYESALIDKATRQRLGTHSTPGWLVDYIIGRLRPWIAEMPPADRKVFEPACGHSAFLVSAMRLLSELLPSSYEEPRKAYLRKRLRGLEKDGFALEIARLSLTLADVPNPNGWQLMERDMFVGDAMARAVQESTIVLANPPFEKFSADEHQPGWLYNKAAETFRRVVENMPPGGVLGFVLPQGFLHSKESTKVRRQLLHDFDLSEISLFADKVFNLGEPESAVLIGRKRDARPQSIPASVRYQRIREQHLGEFKQTYRTTGFSEVSQARLESHADASLVVPDLDEVWQYLKDFPRLGHFAEVGKGFEHRSADDPKRPSGSTVESITERPGFVAGFAGWKESQLTHALPQITWLNLDMACIGRPRHGLQHGASQVLLNYARVSRGPWRLKALIDKQGHPVTSRFLVVRPLQSATSLEVLWAICNSVIGNAFAYSYLGKRDNLGGVIRRMPVPHLSSCDLVPLQNAVTRYLTAARAADAGTLHLETAAPNPATPRVDLFEDPSQPLPDATAVDAYLKTLHWRIDAEVLRLYGLPARLERQLLDLFQGEPRRGVPFRQTEFFPQGFTDLDRLSDFLAITTDWSDTNRRRAYLMDLEEEGTLTAAEATELERLQFLADALVSLQQPWNDDAAFESVAHAASIAS